VRARLPRRAAASASPDNIRAEIGETEAGSFKVLKYASQHGVFEVERLGH
jgi:hypothetical protein